MVHCYTIQEDWIRFIWMNFFTIRCFLFSGVQFSDHYCFHPYLNNNNHFNLGNSILRHFQILGRCRPKNKMGNFINVKCFIYSWLSRFSTAKGLATVWCGYHALPSLKIAGTFHPSVIMVRYHGVVYRETSSCYGGV